MPGAAAASGAGYVPLQGAAAVRRRRRDGEYAARRAVFLQSYQLASVGGGGGGREEGLRGRLARRLREAVARARCWCVGAGLARACRGWARWRPRAAADPLLGGCFGAAHRHKYYLHDDYA